MNFKVKNSTVVHSPSTKRVPAKTVLQVAAVVAVSTDLAVNSAVVVAAAVVMIVAVVVAEVAADAVTSVVANLHRLQLTKASGQNPGAFFFVTVSFFESSKKRKFCLTNCNFPIESFSHCGCNSVGRVQPCQG